MNERRPACDEDSERALLGCILLDSERTFFILNELKFTPEMFYVRAHQIVYQTMLVLAAKHVPVEPIALIERLRTKGHDKEVGGHAYLMKLLDAPTTHTYARHYAEHVVEKYKLRALVNCSKNIQVYIDEGQTAAEIGANLMSSLISQQSIESEENVEVLHNKSLSTARTIHEGGQRPGCPSFLEPINSVLGSYMPGCTYILAATTSNGKTSLACNELEHKTIDLNIPGALISMEMSQRTIRQIMAATIAGVDAFKFFMMGRYTDFEADAVKEAFDKLSKAPLHIIDRRMNIEQIVTWLTYMVKKYGIKFAVLDYIQLIKYSQGHQQLSRNEQTAEWSALLKDTAKRLDIPLLIISQLSRSGNKTRELTPPPPAGEALRDSGMLENDADAIIFIYKKPGEPFESFVTEWPMEVDVFKNRTGPVGTVKVVFQRNRQRFVSDDDFKQINQQQKLKLEKNNEKEGAPKPNPY